MALLRSRPRTVTLENASLDLRAGSKPFSLWSDGIGVIATRSLQILLVGFVVLAVLWLNQYVTVVTIPVLIALIIASAVSPVMSWMRGHGVPSVIATILVLLAIVLALAGVTWLIVWAVNDQWDELSSSAVEGFQQLMAWINTLPFEIDQSQIDSWISTAEDFITSSQFGSGAIAGVSAVATFLTSFVLLIVTLFFFLKDGPRLYEFLLRPFRGEQYERGRRVGDKAVSTLGAYVRGTASVAAVDAIGIFIGLLILQVPLAVPLAVLVFVLAFIPIVGATLAGTLAALVALVANGPIVAIIVVGVVVLVNQLEGNFLQPVLMGRTMKLHAFVILIALTVGTVLGGIVGAVLAVPLTAVAWAIIGVWDGPDTPPRWARMKPREKRLEEDKYRKDNRIEAAVRGEDLEKTRAEG